MKMLQRQVGQQGDTCGRHWHGRDALDDKGRYSI
jgi:hypothetical protein